MSKVNLIDFGLTVHDKECPSCKSNEIFLIENNYINLPFKDYKKGFQCQDCFVIWPYEVNPK